VSPTIAQNFVYAELASEVWRTLKERFAQADLIRISEIQQELYAYKQGTLSVADYFTALNTLWEELDQYRPAPKCSCCV
jgi:hypothetical protein